MARTATKSLFTADLIVPAIGDAFRKLSLAQLIRNPVMFTTAVVALLLTVLLFVGNDGLASGFKIQLIIWLWLTVLLGTFAEGRGKAQTASLRAAKSELTAKKVSALGTKYSEYISTPASALKIGDLVVVETGDLIPSDGEVAEGVASVNEAAITGESAPVIREAGGDRSAVTAGTRVISDQIVVRVTVNPGQGFLDGMIVLVEGAERQKTPQRDRADDPAHRADHHLFDRGRHHSGLRILCGRVDPGDNPPRCWQRACCHRRPLEHPVPGRRRFRSERHRE